MVVTAKIHAVCLSEKFALKIRLSEGNYHDATNGRKLIESFNCKTGCYLLVERAYEDNETLVLELRQGFVSVTSEENKKITLKI